jgi:uncharacterized protein (TIRG00374 family)
VNDTHSNLRRVVGGGVALILIIATLVLARPATVWDLLRTSDPLYLIAAAATAAAALAFRGLRLMLFVGPAAIGVTRATLVAAAAQAAAFFVPARLGELALPLLLQRVAGLDLAAGVGTLLTVRTLDLAATGVWGGISILVIWGFDHPVALLIALCFLIPPLLLPVVLRVFERLALRCLAVRGRRGRRWTRRIRRVRLSVADLSERPGRLLAAFAASVVMYGLLWLGGWLLVTATGFDWPPIHVAAASVAASLSTLLPFNLIGNLGTLEAGWTAVFTVLGVPLDVAAATGLVTHLWSLLFAAVYGLIAWALLELRNPKL